MCGPIAAATLAVTSAAMQVAGRDQQARQAQNAAKDGFIDFASQTTDQQGEINAANSQQKSARVLKAERELATLNASLGDSGLSGNTFDRLTNETEGSAARDLANLEAQRTGNMQQTVQGVSQARRKAENDIRANPRQSLLGAGLQIIGAGMNGYTGAGGKVG